jgi:hypothetical protein
MAKKKSSKSKAETETSFMFPLLHQHVVNAVSHSMASLPLFHETDSDMGVRNQYNTHVMGRFRCTCGAKGWASKKVAILIRRYAGNGYNAVVFNQRCKVCDRLGTLTLDENSYVDRVAYWVQKWAGVQVERPPHSSKKTKPHESALCEGCKRGLCGQGGGWSEYY